ncbi:MAG: hypothetical protein AAFX76_09320, partial [Planctomycetota bacterium]
RRPVCLFMVSVGHAAWTAVKYQFSMTKTGTIHMRFLFTRQTLLSGLIGLIGIAGPAVVASGQQTFEVLPVDDVQLLVIDGALTVRDSGFGLTSEFVDESNLQGIGLEFPLAGLPVAELLQAKLRIDVNLVESNTTVGQPTVFPELFTSVNAGGGDGEFNSADLLELVQIGTTTVDDLGVLEIDLPLDAEPQFFTFLGDDLGELIEALILDAQSGPDAGLAVTLGPPAADPVPDLTLRIDSTELAALTDTATAPTLVLTFVPEPTSLLCLVPLGLMLRQRSRRG